MKTSSPDYGEPWNYDIENGFIVARDGQPIAFLPCTLNRINSCVNACAGMADPAAEIQAMREAIKEAYLAFGALVELPLICDLAARNSAVFTRWNAAKKTLTKLQPFIP